MGASVSREVREQFARMAQAYVTSASHARGADLPRLLELAQPRADQRFLDIATGAGHTLRTFAPRVRAALGVDATYEMLRAARGVLAGGGVQATLVQADVAALPLPDGAMDLAACRIAAHHFPEPRLAFAEAHRVLRPGGTFLLVDNYAPEDPALDAFVNDLERVRDPSHAREHTLQGWRRLLEDVGFAAEIADRLDTRIELDDWLARAGTDRDRAARVRAMLAGASAETARAFAIDERGFVLRKAILVARR
jgi:ubiquinone/menaquinone biosynthesis C-methylase UbiE